VATPLLLGFTGCFPSHVVWRWSQPVWAKACIVLASRFSHQNLLVSKFKLLCPQTSNPFHVLFSEVSVTSPPPPRVFTQASPSTMPLVYQLPFPLLTLPGRNPKFGPSTVPLVVPYELCRLPRTPPPLPFFCSVESPKAKFVPPPWSRRGPPRSSIFFVDLFPPLFHLFMSTVFPPPPCYPDACVIQKNGFSEG